jgi:hypothetical protein
MAHFTKYLAFAGFLLLLSPIAPSFAETTDSNSIAPASEILTQPTQTQTQLGDGQTNCKIQKAAAQAIDIAGTLVTPNDIAQLVVQTAKTIQDVKIPDMNLEPEQAQKLNSALTLAQLLTRNLDAKAIEPTIASLYRTASQTVKKNAQQCTGK